MKLHELRPSPGSHHSRKRVGRGPGSGHGKTATRGQKGQRARTSVNMPKTFEGGQTRLTMRTPKLRGFHNRWKKRFAVLNLTRLNRFEDGAEIRPESLLEAGFIRSGRRRSAPRTSRSPLSLSRSRRRRKRKPKPHRPRPRKRQRPSKAGKPKRPKRPKQARNPRKARNVREARSAREARKPVKARRSAPPIRRIPPNPIRVKRRVRPC